MQSTFDHAFTHSSFCAAVTVISTDWLFLSVTTNEFCDGLRRTRPPCKSKHATIRKQTSIPLSCFFDLETDVFRTPLLSAEEATLV